jgi:hypothetical protein
MQDHQDKEPQEDNAKPTITIAEDELDSPEREEKKPTITIAEKNG